MAFRHSAESGRAKALHQVGAAGAGSSSSSMPVGMSLELRAPVGLDRLGRDGGKYRLALGHVRVAVLAHHVVAHQLVHQPAAAGAS